MGKIIEFIFTRVYVAMLVTGIFWVLTICGGVLLGVGPASATSHEPLCGKWHDLQGLSLVTRLGTLQRKSTSQPIKSFTPSLPLKGFSSMACTS